MSQDNLGMSDYETTGDFMRRLESEMESLKRAGKDGKKEKAVYFSIYIRPDLKEKLTEIAKQHHWSTNTLIVLILEKAVKENAMPK